MRTVDPSFKAGVALFCDSRGGREAREEVIGARGRWQASGGMEDVGERLGESDETAGFAAEQLRTIPGASHYSDKSPCYGV